MYGGSVLRRTGRFQLEHEAFPAAPILSQDVSKSGFTQSCPIVE